MEQGSSGCVMDSKLLASTASAEPERWIAAEVAIYFARQSFHG